MFTRLGPWCHDRKWLVIILWIGVLVVSNGVAGSIGDAYRADFTPPGAESTKGFEILTERFGGERAGQVGTIVFEADQGVRDPAVQEAMQGLFDKVATMPHVTRVESPYRGASAQPLIAPSGPKAGKIAYANVEFPEDVDFVDTLKVRDEIEAAIPQIPGLRVEIGSYLFAEFEEPQAEALGLGFAIIILIIAFGSVLAMGLPIGVALFGIGIGGALVILFSHLMEVPEFAPFIGIMIGLGVGIDYALLIVTRYREQLHAGHTMRESLQIAIDTAGRSVFFAGVTVVISLLGMVLMGISFVQGLAVSASATVAVTVLASLTLLPALLALAGDRIERTRWRGLIAAGLVAVALAGVGLKFAPLLIGLPLAAIVIIAGFFVPALKRELAHRPPKPRQQTTAYRWSRMIQRRPWPAAILGSVALLIVAIPVLGLRLNFSDESNFDEETSTRQAYDLLVDGFGKGFNGPLFLVAALPPGTNPPALGQVRGAVEKDPEVALATPSFPNEFSPTPGALQWTVIPKGGPQDESTSDLVHRLREDVLPPIEQAAGVQVHVTGIVAGQIDNADILSSRMPWFFGAVLALSFLFLMVVFRSLLVPLKAVIMNLLSIGAAYGVVVALFQWGWLSDLTGVSPAPIEPWAPMMLFAIVFGLSMDYEVFLLSRVREEWHRTGDSRTSVADGLAATAKVITAAAAIMVVVFGTFILERDRVMKLMGTGLAVAIFLDATIVRMLLVPATMELLGDRNWWLPRWLDRVLPSVDVEGHIEETAPLDADEVEEIEEKEPALVGGDGGRTRAELYEEAKRRNIPGRSKMTAAELEEALRD